MVMMNGDDDDDNGYHDCGDSGGTHPLGHKVLQRVTCFQLLFEINLFYNDWLFFLFKVSWHKVGTLRLVLSAKEKPRRWAKRGGTGSNAKIDFEPYAILFP